MTTQPTKPHRSALRRLLFPFSLLPFPFLGCAVVPHGPIVSHTVECFDGRSDGMISREKWEDNAFSRGIYFFADPELSSFQAWHTNQSALGGYSHLTVGSASVRVDSNLVPAITATGTAAGDIIGAAIKTAVK